MAISKELETKIRRYYYVENWRVGTISRQLNVHHSTIKRVLAQSGVPKPEILTKRSMIDNYLPFILETLEKYPSLTASRLYDMVCERGYPGRESHFRHLISLHRPRKPAEAYLRLRTFPAEQSQVDWGAFGHITIGRAKRPLNAFVMVLSYSRKIFLRFYFNQRMESFLDGHIKAFETWGGVPKVLLFDNLKSAVLERQGDVIRFNPTLLEFASHYRFEPRPVAVARGNEKGRVERAIRFIRDNFFAGREFKDIDDLNKQATDWCNTRASMRPCPEETTITVQDAYEQEKMLLLELPADRYPSNVREPVKVGKTPYARFDLNDYSVPHTYVRQTLTIEANEKSVFIYDGANLVAEHTRSYDKAAQIENDAHIDELVRSKRKASQHRGLNRLSYAVPVSKLLLEEAAKQGRHLSTLTRAFLTLLDDYGAVALESAIEAAIAENAYSENAVRIKLQQQRDERNLPPPVNLDLPRDKRIQQQVVRPHNLNNYDQLSDTEENNHE